MPAGRGIYFHRMNSNQFEFVNWYDKFLGRGRILDELPPRLLGELLYAAFKEGV